MQNNNNKSMVSIGIPSKTEIFLEKTIRDILEKATGEVEIFPILDGYEPPAEEIVDDPRVHYIRLPATDYSKKRQGINQFVDMCKGEYVMWCDAHCMFAKGFDEQLVKDSQPNWVQVPRRNRLDAENWCLQIQGDDRPPIDYEHIMFKPLMEGGIHGFRWDERTYDRKDIMVDDTLCVQASCFFMSKEWFKKMGFMDLKYQGWGQESEEICFSTWLNGGFVKTNKNTWYSHLHKGSKYGRMYHLSRRENQKSYDYSIKHWFGDHNEEVVELLKKFNTPKLMPGWPKNWAEQIQGLKVKYAKK